MKVEIEWHLKYEKIMTLKMNNKHLKIRIISLSSFMR